MRHASARKLFRERRRPYLCLPSRCRQLPAASTAARVHHSADAVIRLPALVLPDVARLYRKQDRKSTRLNSSHSQISYAVFCLKKKKRYCHISCSACSTNPNSYILCNLV